MPKGSRRPSKSEIPSSIERVNAASPGGTGGGAGEQDSGGHPTGKWFIDDQGRLCLEQECFVLRETPDGMAFDLDPETCSPETRDRLVAAAVKGAKLNFI